MLMSVSPFYNLVVQLSKLVAPQPSLACTSRSFIKCFAEVARYFDAFEQIKSGPYQTAIVNAEDIFSHLIGKFSPLAEQQDCQELLCYLLDGMHKEMLALAKEAPSGEVPSQAVPSPEAKLETKSETNDREDADEGWMEMGVRSKAIKHNNSASGDMEKSLVTDIFGGVFKSEFRAQGKPLISATFEPFYLINLDISQAQTVAQGLRVYFQDQEVEGSPLPHL